MDSSAGARHNPAMIMLRLAALLLVAALAGCANATDTVVVDGRTVPLYRPNGQPSLLPCMIGDRLCNPP
jgi:hypothetical protein